jgi:hypothetical protein
LDFEIFCNEAGILDTGEDPIEAFPSGVTSEDDTLTASDGERSIDQAPEAPANCDAYATNKTGTKKGSPTPVEFNLNGPSMPDSEGGKANSITSKTNIITDEEDQQPSDLAELLMRHHQYGHISMRKLQEMARQDTIPKRLAKCRMPTCSACLYSKATKQPWRGKESKQGNSKELPKRQGHIVSVNQLLSPSPSLIAQMTGFLTTKRYNYATVYVDQLTRFGCVHLQKTAAAMKRLKEKGHLRHWQGERESALRTTMRTMVPLRPTCGLMSVEKRVRG